MSDPIVDDQIANDGESSPVLVEAPENAASVEDVNIEGKPDGEGEVAEAEVKAEVQAEADAKVEAEAEAEAASEVEVQADTEAVVAAEAEAVPVEAEVEESADTFETEAAVEAPVEAADASVAEPVPEVVSENNNEEVNNNAQPEAAAAVKEIPLVNQNQEEVATNVEETKTEAPKSFFKAFDVTCESLMSNKVAALLLWQCPKKTGAVFAAGNVFWYLVQLKGYSIQTLASYAAMLLILSNLVFVKVHPVLAFFKFSSSEEDPHSMVVGASATLLNVDAIADAVKDVASQANALYLNLGRSILRCDDTKRSLMAFGLLYQSSLIGRIFNLPSMLYILFLLAFTLPRAYMSNKTAVDKVLVLIDQQIQTALAKSHEALKPVLAAVKPFLEKIPGFSSNSFSRMKKQE